MGEVPLYMQNPNSSELNCVESKFDSASHKMAETPNLIDLPHRASDRASSSHTSGHVRPYPEYGRDNSYPWSPFPPEEGPSRTRSSHTRRPLLNNTAPFIHTKSHTSASCTLVTPLTREKRARERERERSHRVFSGAMSRGSPGTCRHVGIRAHNL